MIFKMSDMWKIQLTVIINFISSNNDNDKERVMYAKSDNIKIMMNDEADEIIKYQNNLEKIERKDFVFDYAYSLYYNCHKINPNHGGSYIDSPDWIKDKTDN